GLWLCLWRGPIRLWSALPFAAGAAGAALAPVPALFVTGDGEHLAIVRDDGVPVLLRSRSGDFVRSLMSEAAAFDGDPLNLEEQAFARCSRVSCVADVVKRGKAWRILAIRSRDRIDWTQLTTACADADIVVASRRLPRGCNPRWLKLDRAALAQSGGVSLYLSGTPRVLTVNDRLGQHPWRYHPVPWTQRPDGPAKPKSRPYSPSVAAPSAAIPASDQTASSLPPGSMK
nr:competence protein ComEC [Sphingomonas sp.]